MLRHNDNSRRKRARLAVIEVPTNVISDVNTSHENGNCSDECSVLSTLSNDDTRFDSPGLSGTGKPSVISSNCNSTITSDANIPKGFLCPLTMEIMFDPVLDSEGNTYERGAVTEWLTKNTTSPISRQPLSERMLIPNNSLRDAIHEFMGNEWVEKEKLKRREAVPARESSTQSRFRAQINTYLKFASEGVLSGAVGLLQLNKSGCCAFRYDGITIFLDVPEDVGIFCLYTKDLIPADVLSSLPALAQSQVYKRALELNFLQSETRGGCLSLRKNEAVGGEEIMFDYIDRVLEVCAKDFSNILFNFVETAVFLREKILSAVVLPQLSSSTSFEQEALQQQQHKQHQARLLVALLSNQSMAVAAAATSTNNFPQRQNKRKSF